MLSPTVDSDPTITVIIPCFNCERYLAEALQSVFEQAYPQIQVIVVDDGSTDRSAAVAAGFDRVQLIKQRNAGVSTARNTGLKVATGNLVVFLDADDRLLPDALSCAAEFFSEPELVMVFGGNRVIDEAGICTRINVQERRNYTYRDVLHGMTPCPSQCMFRRSAVVAAGGFNAEISLAEDWDLFLRLVSLGSIRCHGRIVADYRVHDGQTRAASRAFRSALKILDRQTLISQGAQNRSAIRSARRHWKNYYAHYLAIELVQSIMRLDIGHASRCAWDMTASLPYSLLGSARFVWQRVLAATTPRMKI